MAGGPSRAAAATKRLVAAGPMSGMVAAGPMSGMVAAAETKKMVAAGPMSGMVAAAETKRMVAAGPMSGMVAAAMVMVVAVTAGVGDPTMQRRSCCRRNRQPRTGQGWSKPVLASGWLRPRRWWRSCSTGWTSGLPQTTPS